MAQLKKVVEPFGEVNVHPAAGGKIRVVATILMEPSREGTQTGIALDGSGSMAPALRRRDSRSASWPACSAKKPPGNEITPVAQRLCAYLAGKIDADGGTTCIYWATGPGGSEIEEVGDLTADQAEHHDLRPAQGVRHRHAARCRPSSYFVDRFKDAPWGFYVFITDGELHDLDAVKQYSTQLARDVMAETTPAAQVRAHRRRPRRQRRQMEELDDLDTGTDVDLWDHKIAAEMRVLQEIFAEVVDKNARDRRQGPDP